MIIRQNVFDCYWQFAAKRQEVFFSRMLGKSKPWSNDPILEEYKFCNAYRASDRTSQFLLKEVIYPNNKDIYSEEDVVFRILLFKIFNKIETWQHLQKDFGNITLKSFNFKKYSSSLQKMLNAKQPIYTAAYMSCANKAFGYDRKHQNHLALLQKMCIEDDIAREITKAKNFKEVFENLKKYSLIGNFMAYQLATDINYSEVVDFSENDFAIAGPGAIRGIKKCFLDSEKLDDSEVIRWMQKNQKKEFKKLGLNFKDLFGRELQLIDCQNLFCETDKYARVAFPELKSQRVRIKIKFNPQQNAIRYFYPPKWKINDKIDSFLQNHTKLL